jgi:hypothetical protein
MVDCFVSEVKIKGHWNFRGASERRGEESCLGDMGDLRLIT